MMTARRRLAGGQGFAGHLILFEAGCRPLKLPLCCEPFYCGRGARETDRCIVTVVGRNVTGHMPVKILWRVGDSKGGKNSCFPPLACFSFATSFCTSKKKWRVLFLQSLSLAQIKNDLHSPVCSKAATAHQKPLWLLSILCPAACSLRG